MKTPVDFYATQPELASAERKLKIALLGYRSHPFVGGQGVYIKYLSRALRSRGHTVHVYSGQPYPELDEDIKLIKVPSLNLYEHKNHIRALRWHHLFSFSDFYEWWTMATGGFGEPYTFGRRALKRLKHSDYDIIHDNQSLSSALLKLESNGHKVVSTIHHPIHRDRDLALAEEEKKGMRTLIRRWYSFLKMQERVAKNLKHIVTVSEQSQKDIEKYFGRPKTITPIFFNGIDTNTFKPKPSIEKKALSLLTTSSSDQVLKGLKSLLLALSEVKKSNPEINLTIIGELKKNGSTERLIKSLNLEKNISFKNSISTSSLVELYNRSTVFICPSLYEGFGLPVAEALACGSVVISSNGGALPEVVGDAGLIYEANDDKALAELINKTLTDERLKSELRRRARERALNVFCWDKVAEQLNNYYEDILNT